MPLKFWDEAFLTATYLINRMPSKVIDNQSPLERLFHQQPDYANLRTFGCAYWPNLRPYNSKKLQYRSKECVFLGYSHMHKGFKCLDVAAGRVYISRDVVFDENVYPFSKLHSNAGALLRAEISLLPEHLLPLHDRGDDTNYESSCANPTNDSVEEILSSGNMPDTSNLDQNGGQMEISPVSPAPCVETGARSQDAPPTSQRIGSALDPVLDTDPVPASPRAPSGAMSPSRGIAPRPGGIASSSGRR
jgi:hypothetical protein